MCGDCFGGQQRLSPRRMGLPHFRTENKCQYFPGPCLCLAPWYQRLACSSFCISPSPTSRAIVCTLTTFHGGYRGYSKLRTRTALGSYGRSMPRSIGPSYGWCVFLISSNPCTVQPPPPCVSQRVARGLSLPLSSPSVSVSSRSLAHSAVNVTALSPTLQGYLAHKKTHPLRTLP